MIKLHKQKVRMVSVVVLTFCLVSKAQQNLVPNWSFEDTVHCPVGLLDGFAKYWINPTGPSGQSSPNYYHGCGSWVTTPNNPSGNQIARTGIAYAGIYVFQTTNPPSSTVGCEGIETPLKDSLQSSKQYCVSFYVSCAEYSSYSLICSDMGAYLSDTLINSSSLVLNFTPQIENPYSNFITDTSNWTKISGTFIANGGEQFLTITNFNLRSDTIRMGSGGNFASYFYIDDVSVVEVTPAFAGNDTTACNTQPFTIGGTATFAADYIWSKISGAAAIDSINIANPHISSASGDTSIFAMQKTQCSVVTYDTVRIVFKNCTGIEENNFENYFSIYPNPANNEIIIKTKKVQEKFSLQLFDVSGREIKKISSQKNESLNINTTELENGIYLLKFSLQDGKILSKRIMVNH